MPTSALAILAPLCLLMTPAMSLYYAGLVRRKNVLATLQLGFASLAVVGVQWVVLGASLVETSGGLDGLIGGLGWALGRGGPMALRPKALDPEALSRTATLLAAAALAPAVMAGAMAERVRSSAFVLACLLWTTLVYDPVAHWVWGPRGWLAARVGTVDFAGGLVVHVLAGVGGLAGAMVVGRRRGLDEDEMKPHNLTLTVVGTALLWAAWLGFNAARAERSPTGMGVAVLNTIVAGSAGILGWLIVEWMHQARATVLGTCSGAVAGLVAITPGAAWMAPLAAIALGFGAAPLAYGFVAAAKRRLRVDDALDVFGLHGVAGAAGVLGLGLFASDAWIAESGAKMPGGLLDGRSELIGAQAIGLAVVMLYGFVASWAVFKLVDVVWGLRVDADAEDAGLDLSQHGQRGYIMDAAEFVAVREEI